MTYRSVEEMNLIALIDTPKESRMAAIVKLTRRMDELEEGVAKVAKAVIDKLARISDEEYMQTSFIATIA